MPSFIDDIKVESAKAYHYFTIFYDTEFEQKLDSHAFEDLSFAYQLGVFIEFFDRNSADVQLYGTSSDILKESIKEAFSTYEEYLFLDS